MTPSSAADCVTGDMMLPDVLRVHPKVRVVFDRYGLRGCGGPLGPAESVAYFARAHGVDIVALLDELNEGVRDPDSLPALEEQASKHPMDELADTIYRGFFKAAIVVILTAGAVWGAVLLLRIGFSGSFTTISIHDINAHGHAQIFGWVGLFVMGFAYQAFPRIKHTNLWRPDLANMTFFLMVFGIFARAIGEPLFKTPMMREFAIAGGMAEIAAIALFIAIIVNTFRQSGKPYEGHDVFILLALAFFLIQACGDLALMYGTTAAISREALLSLVATYQVPLRDVQIHGFAMFMILGVGIRMIPALFGFPSPSRRLVRTCLILLTVAVVGEVVFFILMRRTGDRAMAFGWVGSVILLAGATIALTHRWVRRPRQGEWDRSSKFVRASMIWLGLSMMMLVLLPVYMQWLLPAIGSASRSGQEAIAMGFSHAYFGAVRHAITVGFISLMILGMAAKIVPTLCGVDVRRLGSLWLPFVLVNVGCFMRVGFQVTTDFAEWAFPLAGVSGVIEVAGIGIWSVHLWRIMAGWKPAPQIDTQKPTRLTADHTVGRIVEWFPQTLPMLLAKGFAPLANPIIRKTMARTITVRTAASHQGLDVDELLSELNRVAFGPGSPPPASEAGGKDVGLLVLPQT